tara:strand:+ start:188 stop:409 length:222 start_codon:yes stop_codon:yes gene_type:complete
MITQLRKEIDQINTILTKIRSDRDVFTLNGSYNKTKCIEKYNQCYYDHIVDQNQLYDEIAVIKSNNPLKYLGK